MDRYKPSPEGPATRLENERAQGLAAARAAKAEEGAIAASRLLGGLKGAAFEALQAEYLSVAERCARRVAAVGKRL